MIVVSVIYPRSEAAFDFDYYVNVHIPLVTRIWSPHLAKVEVLRGVSPVGGEAEPDFTAITLLHFLSEDDLKCAFGSERSAEVAADIAKFSSAAPKTQINAALPLAIAPA